MLLIASGLFLTASFATMAKDLRVGMENYEPYYIVEGNTGLVADLISAVFRHMPEHQPIYLFGYSANRRWSEFRKGKLDVIPGVDSTRNFDGCLSDPIYPFLNVAVTNARSGVSLSKLSDLSGKFIVTFQGARGTLGTEFSNAVLSDHYHEVSIFTQQAKMLHRGRVEVSVGDKLLFLHSLLSMKNTAVTRNDFVFHDIFPPTESFVAFRDQELCLQFNEALRKVQNSGEYEEIYRSYAEQSG